MAESQDIHPQNTSVVIIKTEKGVLYVESLPPVTKGLRGAVKLPLNTSKCILSLHSDEGHYFGFTEVGKIDLDSLRKEPGIDHRFERDLEPYLISFSLSVGPRDAAQLACGCQELGESSLVTNDRSLNSKTAVVSKSESLIPSPRLNLSLYFLDVSTQGPELLNMAGHLFLERYISSTLQIDLDNSTSAYDLAVKMLSPNDGECSKYQFDASIAYYNRFRLLGKIFDITYALKMLQSAIDQAPEDRHDIGAHRTSLAQDIAAAFDWTKDLDYVSKRISSLLEEIESTPGGDANLKLVDGLALCLRSRFEQSRCVAELFETTLKTFRKASFPSVHTLSEDANDSGLDANSDNAVLSLKEQFEQGIDPGQLSMTIASLQDASCQLPPAADLADITESLSLHQKVIKNTPNPNDHPELPGYLSNFGNTLQCRFEHTGNENNLSMAIYSFQCAVELTPEGDTVLPARWIALGSLLKQRFELGGKEDDLSKAVSAHRSAVKSSQMDDLDFDYLETLNSLGSILLFSFDHTKDLNDVSEAVTTFREMVGRTPDKDFNLPRYLNNLGEALRRRFRQRQAEEDLSEAISSLEKALEISSDADEQRPAFLTNLGLSFHAHFTLENDTKKSQMPELHNDLELMFQVQSRVKIGAQPPDTDNPSLNKAINLHRMAIRLSPDQHPALHDYLNNLAIALQSRFELYGDSADLSEALSAILRAIDITPKGDRFLPALLDKLGELLWEKFERDAGPDDLSKVISTYRYAIDLTPSDNVNGLCERRSNLGNALMASFYRSGDIGESSEAIILFRKLVSVATLDEHLDLPRHLNNLGESLRRRFQLGRFLPDLSEAISSLQQAVEVASHRDRKRIPALLNNLANTLQIYFKYYEDPEDLSAAISSQKRAVDLASSTFDHRESLLNNLGLFLLHRFKINQDPKDISDAISSFREAIRLTHSNTPALPLWQNNLSQALHQRFESTGNSEDLSEAIKLQEEAIRLTPECQKSWSRRHYGLGVLQEALYACTNDVKDISSATSHYRQAATSLTGFPSSRIIAARKWARCSEKHDPSQTLEAYGAAVELLSVYAAMNTTVESRHAGLKLLSGLAPESAAAAFARGEVELGLEWLEQGRCVVWNQLDRLRVPFQELIAEHPEIKVKLERLQRASGRLEMSGSREIGPSAYTASWEEKASLEEESIEHIKHAKEYNRLLGDMRHSGMGNFLRPRKTADILSKLPRNGLVILINIHEDQGHALALTPDVPLAAISLTRVSQKWAEGLRSRLEACVSPSASLKSESDRAGGPANSKPSSILPVLQALWVDLVEPVFDAIGYQDRPESPRRIWWCVTGPLAFLPIHAAGIYGKTGVCLSDFAISSYIPSVSTLVDHRRKTTEAVPVPRILLVSQAKAPNMPLILGVDEETVRLRKLIEGHGLSVQHLAGKDATVGNATKEMSSCQWVHLACHATQNPLRPLKSSFHLLDGQLDLFEVIKLNIPDADLAFLSACQTSRTGDERLSDEAVHLAAGMLAAGYRSVVSTMWPIGDSDGADVAESFYSHLLNGAEEGGKPRPDGTGAAHAIHHATQRLRERLGDTDRSFLTWVPYVHFGV